jgi:hypothetical protein
VDGLEATDKSFIDPLSLVISSRFLSCLFFEPFSLIKWIIQFRIYPKSDHPQKSHNKSTSNPEKQKFCRKTSSITHEERERKKEKDGNDLQALQISLVATKASNRSQSPSLERSRLAKGDMN